MIKSLATSLALVLAVGCASVPMHNGTDTGAGASTHVDVANYVLLSSPSAVRDIDFMKPVRDFNIKGSMTSRGFQPVGKIEGNGSFCAEGKDWLSLSDLTVHKASDGKAPAAPYVSGCATASGFQPASRDIVTQ